MRARSERKGLRHGATVCGPVWSLRKTPPQGQEAHFNTQHEGRV